ncbi:hypothetical protein R3P38DRAFT_3216463 [Favolaschia claudopus]|uniref:Uncharacterized protein n=1 Tax=Favolaschia claudopus TaxID=2862362 RepID=A0AAW0A601_9AGAR
MSATTSTSSLWLFSSVWGAIVDQYERWAALYTGTSEISFAFSSKQVMIKCAKALIHCYTSERTIYASNESVRQIFGRGVLWAEEERRAIRILTLLFTGKLEGCSHAGVQPRRNSEVDKRVLRLCLRVRGLSHDLVLTAAQLRGFKFWDETPTSPSSNQNPGMDGPCSFVQHLGIAGFHLDAVVRSSTCASADRTNSGSSTLSQLLFPPGFQGRPGVSGDTRSRTLQRADFQYHRRQTHCPR